MAKLPSNFPRSERCRSLSAASVFNVDELIAKGLGLALQIRQYPITIFLLIRLLSRVHVCRAIPQHAQDEPSQRMRGRRHGFGCPEPYPYPPVIGPQGTVTVGDALGRQPQGRRRAIGGGCAPYSGAFAPRDVVARTSPEPRRTMRARRPTGPIETNLTDHLQSREALDPLDLGEVHPGHRLKRGLHSKTQRVAAA